MIVLISDFFLKDFDGGSKGSMAVKANTYIGVTRAEAITHKADYADGWIKVTNLESEQSGYMPVSFMEFIANNV